jgi:hypothetical protein
MPDEPRSVGEILERLGKAAGHKEDMPIGDVVQALGSRSYGPFLLVPALIELSPVGGIPGVPSILALIVILFAGQMLVGRKHFWLPQRLSRINLSSEKIVQAVEKVRPIGKWLDRWFHGRLRKLTEGPATRAAAAACILLALTVPPLEFLPFASSAPMSAIAMFGLALLVRDGALMIGAGLVACVAVALLFSVAAG